VLVWDGSARQWLAPFHETNYFESIDWSPNGQTLAVGTEAGIDIWDVNTREIITNLKGHKRSVDSLEWSPDGSELASGSTLDGSVFIWDMPGGQRVNSMSFENVECLAWSPDGKTLAIGAGKDVVLWTNP
jgi:WD40 repeat protein